MSLNPSRVCPQTGKPVDHYLSFAKTFGIMARWYPAGGEPRGPSAAGAILLERMPWIRQHWEQLRRETLTQKALVDWLTPTRCDDRYRDAKNLSNRKATERVIAIALLNGGVAVTKELYDSIKQGLRISPTRVQVKESEPEYGYFYILTAKEIGQSKIGFTTLADKSRPSSQVVSNAGDISLAYWGRAPYSLAASMDNWIKKTFAGAKVAGKNEWYNLSPEACRAVVNGAAAQFDTPLAWESL